MRRWVAACSALVALACASCAAGPDITVSGPIPPPPGPEPDIGRYWETTNPGGGGPLSAPAVSTDGSWAVGTDRSGLAITADRGRSWIRVGAIQGLTAARVDAVLPVPGGGGWLAGTSAGLFVVSPDGLNARSLESFPAERVVTALGASADGSEVWVASHLTDTDLLPVVHRSVDGGLTWDEVAGLPEGLRLDALDVDPNDAGSVAVRSRSVDANGAAAEVWSTTDGGLSWQQAAAEIGGAADMAFDPTEPGHLLVSGVDGGLWRWRTGGPAERISDHGGLLLGLGTGTDASVRSLDVQSQETENPTAGWWESPNGGGTWIRRSEPASWVTGWGPVPGVFGPDPRSGGQSLAVDPDDDDTVLWATRQFLYASEPGSPSLINRSTGPGEHGGARSTGLDNVVALDVETSPAIDGVVYAGYADLGCWRSDDGGEAWTSCNQADLAPSWDGFGGTVTALVTDPTEPAVVWGAFGDDLAGGQVVARSDQKGAPGTWVVGTGLPADAPVTDLLVESGSPAGARRVWAAVGGDLYLSVDHGATWALATTCGGCQRLWAGAGRLMTGGEAGLWSTTDGREWTQLDVWASLGPRVGPWWEQGWEGVSGLAIDPVDPNRWWVAITGRGLVATADAGTSWAEITDDRWIRDVLVPGDGSVWTASSSTVVDAHYDVDSFGVLISLDGGRTWAQEVDGLSWPFALRFEKQSDERPWVATAGEGIARRVDDPPPTAGGGFVG